jgi:putative hemolysin
VILQLVVVALLILLNAFFAAAEIAIVSANRIRLGRLADDGDRRARRALALVKEPGKFLATVQVGITLAGFFASAVGAVSAAELLGNVLRAAPSPLLYENATIISVAATTSVIAFLSLILGELTPKNLALRNAEAVALSVAYPIALIQRITRPVVWLLNATTNLLLGGNAPVKVSTITHDEIAAMADAAEAEGVIDEKENQIVQGAFLLREKRIGELVVPRVDVRAVSVDTTLAEARKLIVQTGHSRIPIYRGTIDEIVSVLHSKDLLAALDPGGRGADRKVVEIARQVIYVPESVKADEVLRQMQRQRIHLAVVVDEYGGTAGIVTLDNLLEEIVGPIRDEYDAAEQPETRLIEDGVLVASGDADLDHVADTLEVKLEEQEVDTVGGLVYSALGRIPEVGDSVEVNGARIEVLRMLGNRVGLVRITRLTSPVPESG